MPNNNSKKQSIYNPTGGKRLSKKRIYKLLKKDKMNGGGVMETLGKIFGGDPENMDESKSSSFVPPSQEPVDVPSQEPVDVPSQEPVDVPSQEPVDVPSQDSIESSSEEPESNIDGQGNLDNSLSVTDNKEGSSLFDTALETAKGVGNTISNSVSNTAEEVSAAVNSPDIINDDESDDDDDDDDDNDDDDEDKNKLMEIIADQNKTIDNQNTTIDNLNQTIKEQSNKLVEILETQITNLKQTTTDDNTIQYPHVNSPMSIGSPSMSTDNMDSLPNRTGVGGKTKGRRSTKKRRSK